MNRSAVSLRTRSMSGSARVSYSLKMLLLINSLLLGILALISCRAMSGGLYSALFSALLVIAVAIDLSSSLRPSRIVLDLTSVAVLFSAVMRIRFSNFISVLTESVLLMCAIKMMEDKRSRDYRQIAMLSVFTIISAAADMADETYI